MWINAMVTALERVYAICPIVRQQPSGSPLHLAPQWVLQAEIAWATGEEIMHWEEGLLRYIGERLLEQHASLLPPGSESRLSTWRRPLPVVRYDEALALLAAAGARPAPGCEFTARERTVLDQKFATPYFIVDIPVGLAPLVTRTDSESPHVSCAHRLMSGIDQAPLAIGAERVSAWQAEPQHGLRATRADPLHSVPWFADTRRFGCVPHSGFELQLNMLVALALGVSPGVHDREVRNPFGL
jgi:asparaginyl-tRNA synthetase